MTTANADNVKKRVISIVQANPGAWVSTVSGEVGAFPTDAEIWAAILEADEYIAVQGYFQSVNQTLGSTFLTVSGILANGDALPVMRGGGETIEISPDGVSGWKKSVRAAHLDEITNARAGGAAYVGGGAFDHLYFIENGRLYLAAGYARVSYPVYVRTGALQCAQNEEFLLIATAVRFLTKNASPAPFEIYRAESAGGIQQLIMDGRFQQPAGDGN